MRRGASLSLVGLRLEPARQLAKEVRQVARPSDLVAASSATMSIPSVIAAAGYPSRSSSMASSRIFWATASHSDFSSMVPLPDP